MDRIGSNLFMSLSGDDFTQRQ